MKQMTAKQVLQHRLDMVRHHHQTEMTPSLDGYQLAKDFVIKKQTTNVSRVQRYLKAPYAVADGYIQNMEAAELISKPNGKGKRRVLVKWKDYKGPDQ